MAIKVYRNDIDGIRALSVLSVILFHLGYLKNGYLGVDVFFVISGFLITGIVFDEVVNEKFSLLKFYERRLRRIFPLVLFATIVSLFIGYVVMLPDDFENLCQSIIASNFSANNILMYITSSDYWAVKNDFKPLMHTWSLGVEEQFYIVFPFVIFCLSGKFKHLIFPALIFLALISFSLFLIASNSAAKFYFIQYRFFELSFGGILSIVLRKYSHINFAKFKGLSFLFLIAVCILLFFSLGIKNDLLVILITVFSSLLLFFGSFESDGKSIYSLILTNRVFVFLGKISFSLYIWHQIVFAFSRYFVYEEFSDFIAVLTFIVTLLFSIFTYFLIENPFRNREKVKTQTLILNIASFFIIVNLLALYFYSIGGVVRDVPSLGITKNSKQTMISFFDSRNNTNISYNENARNFDVGFNDTTKVNILVIGDSFGRDLINVFKESGFKSSIEYRYVEIWEKEFNDDVESRIKQADIVFVATQAAVFMENFQHLSNFYNLDSKNVILFGIKDFGNSNGIFYSQINSGTNCNDLRGKLKLGVFDKNEKLKAEWGNKYMDVLSFIIDKNKLVTIFTPDCKFISQDTMHLTQFGAIYLAELLEDEFKKRFNL